jgi:hypothetical protein
MVLNAEELQHNWKPPAKLLQDLVLAKLITECGVNTDSPWVYQKILVVWLAVSSTCLDRIPAITNKSSQPTNFAQEEIHRLVLGSANKDSNDFTSFELRQLFQSIT